MQDLEVVPGADKRPVFGDGEMQVVARGGSGRSDFPDQLPARHDIPDLHQARGEMEVGGLNPVPVVDRDIVPTDGIAGGDDDLPARIGIDRGSVRRRNVDPGMEGPQSGEGVVAIPVVAGEPSGHDAVVAYRAAGGCGRLLHDGDFRPDLDHRVHGGGHLFFFDDLLRFHIPVDQLKSERDFLASRYAFLCDDLLPFHQGRILDVFRLVLDRLDDGALHGRDDVDHGVFRLKDDLLPGMDVFRIHPRIQFKDRRDGDLVFLSDRPETVAAFHRICDFGDFVRLDLLPDRFDRREVVAFEFDFDDFDQLRGRGAFDRHFAFHIRQRAFLVVFDDLLELAFIFRDPPTRPVDHQSKAYVHFAFRLCARRRLRRDQQKRPDDACG